MKKIFVLGLLVLISHTTFAVDDARAWKKESTLDKQFNVFKSNLNSWKGFLSVKEPQLNEFYKVVGDSISKLEGVVSKTNVENAKLKSTIDGLNENLSSTKTKLDESLLLEDSFSTMGISLLKDTFASVMYFIALALLLTVGVLFYLFKKSHRITKDAKEKYVDLEKEFDAHKKNNLERYTKLNRELHDAKMKLGAL
ncbi:MAG: hypothetical protein KAG96_00625 [Ichthyobacteriaceae bacterium]|nr:hypothetical protein [Ichthyobacteriaceae bacterium]